MFIITDDQIPDYNEKVTNVKESMRRIVRLAHLNGWFGLLNLDIEGAILDVKVETYKANVCIHRWMCNLYP